MQRIIGTIRTVCQQISKPKRSKFNGHLRSAEHNNETQKHKQGMSNKKALGFNEEAARCEPEEICFHRVPHHSMDTVDTSHRPLTLWLYHNSPRRGEANEEATQTQAGGSLETQIPVSCPPYPLTTQF